ncbi:MAG: O-antigen ligase family protein [Bacteroidetes bacterium]|nr:O-antigen ligase family protein [Bacteroidota bacterium]
MGKVVALLSYTGVGLLMALTIVGTNPELDVQDRYFIWVVVGLSVAALLNAVFTQNRSRFGVIDGMVVLFFLYLFVNYHFISPINTSAKWFQTLYLFILYGSLRLLLPSCKEMERYLMAAVMICGLWESILGLMQVLGFCASHHPLYAFTGSYVNTGPYGGFLAVIMSISMGYMVKHYPLSIKINSDTVLYLLSGLSFCFAFVVFFAAMSRAAILGLLIGVAVIAVTQPNAKRWLSNISKKKRLLFAAVCSVIIFGSGAMYYLKKESADSRLTIWKISCNLIGKEPVLGSGFGSFFGAYSAESAATFATHPHSAAITIIDVPEYSFNEYLQTGVETGIVGMMLLISTLFGATFRHIKKKSLFGYGLIVIMVFSFFSFPFSQLPFLILLVLFVATGAEPGICMKKNSCALVQRVPAVLLSIVLVVSGWGLSGFYGAKIEATEAWQKVRPLYRSQRYNEARQEYAALYPNLKDNPRFLFEYGHALNKTERFVPSNAVLKEGALMSSDPMFYNVMGNNYKGLGDFVHAEEAYKFAFDILPNRLYPLYLLMKLYMETGQEEKVYEMAQKVVAFSPKIDSPAIREMKRAANALLP